MLLSIAFCVFVCFYDVMRSKIIRLVLLLIGVVFMAWVNVALSVQAKPLYQSDKKATPTVTSTLEAVEDYKKKYPTAMPVYVVNSPEDRKLESLEIPEIAPITQLASRNTVGSYYLTAEEILPIIDQYLEIVWDSVVSRQLQYYQQSHGRYMQGLKSHSSIPVDGNHEYPDLFLSSPSDWPATWLDMDILPFSPSPYAFTMDVYDGQYGSGFVFCVEIVIESVTYKRCMNYGGEIWRNTRGWVTTP